MDKGRGSGKLTRRRHNCETSLYTCNATAAGPQTRPPLPGAWQTALWRLENPTHASHCRQGTLALALLRHPLNRTLDALAGSTRTLDALNRGATTLDGPLCRAAPLATLGRALLF